MRFPIGAMSVGDILDRGLKLYLARMPLFYGISLIALAPLIALQLFIPVLQANASGDSAAMMAITMLLGGLGVLVLTLILQPIATAAFVYVVAQEYVDRQVTMGQALSAAMGRFGPLIVTSLLGGLLIGLGLLACVIPGIYLSVIWAFIGQTVVLEKLMGMEALKRSSSLVQGFFWRVLGILVLVGAINFIVQLLLVGGLELVLPSHDIVTRTQTFGGQTMQIPTQVPRFPNAIIHVLITQLVSILFTCYGQICQTLLYLDLRIRKEGFDLEIAARQQKSAEGPDDGV
ncbi:MAG: hypothetical protein U0746_12895 [Gemmataceae bacterium]